MSGILSCRRNGTRRTAGRLVRLGIALLLSLGSTGSLRAQSASSSVQPVVPESGPGYTTLAAFTLPPTFYVGDRVELRIRLKLSNGVAIRAPAQMPENQWIKVDSITVSHTSDYSVVHIYFASYAPGERAFPPIDLGEVSLEGIRITTASLVAAGNTRLSDPKGQLALPGTTLILALAVALLIGAPLVIIVLYRRFRTAFGDFLEKQRARRPWRQLRRVLDALAAQKEPLDARGFYITLGVELRRYLSLKFGSDFRAVTAREFAAVARSVDLEEGAALGLSAIMSFGELVKFAGEGAPQEALRRDLDEVRRIAEGIEETAERELRARQLAASSGSRRDRPEDGQPRAHRPRERVGR